MGTEATACAAPHPPITLRVDELPKLERAVAAGLAAKLRYRATGREGGEGEVEEGVAEIFEIRGREAWPHLHRRLELL